MLGDGVHTCLLLFMAAQYELEVDVFQDMLEAFTRTCWRCPSSNSTEVTTVQTGHAHPHSGYSLALVAAMALFMLAWVRARRGWHSLARGVRAIWRCCGRKVMHVMHTTKVCHGSSIGTPSDHHGSRYANARSPERPQHAASAHRMVCGRRCSGEERSCTNRPVPRSLMRMAGSRPPSRPRVLRLQQAVPAGIPPPTRSPSPSTRPSVQIWRNSADPVAKSWPMTARAVLCVRRDELGGAPSTSAPARGLVSR